MPLVFERLTKKELRQYNEWFHAVLPSRIAMLEGLVRSSAEFESWRADFSPGSLAGLSAWFDGAVESRPRSAAEIAEARAKVPLHIEVPTTDLTERTYSIAMDVGMYLGEVVRRNVPGTRWEQETRKVHNYGQPAVWGRGKVCMNPVHLAVVQAFRVQAGEAAEFPRLLDVWAKMIGPEPMAH